MAWKTWRELIETGETRVIKFTRWYQVSKDSFPKRYLLCESDGRSVVLIEEMRPGGSACERLYDDNERTFGRLERLASIFDAPSEDWDWRISESQLPLTVK